VFKMHSNVGVTYVGRYILWKAGKMSNKATSTITVQSPSRAVAPCAGVQDTLLQNGPV
jgi:hypothetical protein